MVVGVAVLAAGSAGSGRRSACEDAEGRDGHRRQRAERPRLQPPRLRRAPAGAEAARGSRSASRSRARPPTTSRTSRRSRARATTSSSASGTRRSARWARSPSASRRRASRSSTSPTGISPASRRTSSASSSARSRSATSPGTSPGSRRSAFPGEDVVSSVAGEKQPPVDRFIAGYQAGAKKADPKRHGRSTRYSQDFNDQAKCKAIALNQIAAGSVAVFAVAGGCGLGALDAARERKVWGIGVDADQSFLGAAHPDERDEEGRPGGVPRDQVGRRRARSTAAMPSTASRRAASGSARSARGCRSREVAARRTGSRPQLSPGRSSRRGRCMPLAERGNGASSRHVRHDAARQPGPQISSARSSPPRPAPRPCARRAPAGARRSAGRSPSTEKRRPERACTAPSRRRIPIASVCGSAATSPTSCTGAAGTPAAASFSSQAARVSSRSRAESASTSVGRFATRSGLVAKRGSSASSRQPDRLDEPPEEPVVRGGDHQPAVRRREDLVRRDRVEAPSPAASARRRSRSCPIRW